MAGIIASGLVLLVATLLVREETQHLHNELALFTVTNIAVSYVVLLAFIAIVDLEKAAETAEREAVLAP